MASSMACRKISCCSRVIGHPDDRKCRARRHPRGLDVIDEHFEIVDDVLDPLGPAMLAQIRQADQRRLQVSGRVALVGDRHGKNPGHGALPPLWPGPPGAGAGPKPRTGAVATGKLIRYRSDQYRSDQKYPVIKSSPSKI